MATRGKAQDQLRVNPALLVWARQELNLSLKDAASRLKISEPQLAQLERGDRAPGLEELRHMARVYHVPLVTLLFPRPPSPLKLPEDRRGGQAPLTEKTILAMRHVQEWQARLSRLVAEDPRLYPAPQLSHISTNENPEWAAEQERRLLQVSAIEQLEWADPAEAFAQWRWRVESRGVLVFSVVMETEECRGFSLWNGQALPAIAVNRAETDAAKTFTLFHEYGHLLLRQAALCEFDLRGPTESFCNRFAAGLLMTVEVLARALQVGDLNAAERRTWTTAQLGQVANKLKVSQQALALRLEQLRLAPEGALQAVIAGNTGVWRRPGGRGGVGVPLAHRRVAERGLRYTAAVLRALQQELIDPLEADELLGLAPKHFKAVETRIEAERERLSLAS